MITMTNGLTATDEFKNQYNELMMNVFGFSFDRWYEKNVWDDHYECCSIMENGTIIANASIFKMKLLINGMERDCLQFGAVATRREHRGKGFARKIINHILDMYPNRLSLLFANDDVLEFYPKFGFVPIMDKQPYIKWKVENDGEMIKLDLANPKVDRYLKECGQFSRIFDCTNQYSINWFHLLMSYSEDIYEIPELDIMIVAKQQGNILVIHDIIAKNPISFSQIVPHLHFQGVEIIQFGFNPDWLGIVYDMEEYKMENSTLFVRGNLEITREAMVPWMMRT